MIEYLYQGAIRGIASIENHFSQDKMKSFSLDIPALEETIGYLNGCIENMKEIGNGVVQTGENLVSDSWDGKATVNFLENMNNWKNDYDTFLSNVICFRDALEMEILPKAKEVNELALSLAATLGGTKGAEGKNIISMEPEGIEELKGRCKNLVNDVYEEQNEIMNNIISLESKLHYGSPVAQGVTKNKNTIQDNQQKLQNYHNRLAEYEAEVQALESLTVEKMAACNTICGQKLDADKFKQFLAYSKENNITKILNKSTENLTEVEKLAIQYALQTGNTEEITEYLNKKFGLEDMTCAAFMHFSVAERERKLGKITEYLAKLMPNVSVSNPDIEIPIGVDMKVYYYLTVTNLNTQGNAFTINTIAGHHNLKLQSITASISSDSSFTIGKDGTYVFTVNNSMDNTIFSLGPAQNVLNNEFGFEGAMETQIEIEGIKGAVKSTIGIKKSVNVRPGWETVPVEVPDIATEPWYEAEYPTGLYSSPYSFDETLESVGEFCNDHPVITGLTVVVVVGAAAYFTGGLALVAI